MAQFVHSGLYMRAIDFLLLKQTPHDPSIVERIGLIREHLIEPGDKLPNHPHVFTWLERLVSLYVKKYVAKEFIEYQDQATRTGRNIQLLAGVEPRLLGGISGNPDLFVHQTLPLASSPQPSTQPVDDKQLKEYRALVVILYKISFTLLFWPTFHQWLTKEESGKRFPKTVFTDRFFSSGEKLIPRDVVYVDHISSPHDIDVDKERQMVQTILDYFEVALGQSDIWKGDQDDVAKPVVEPDEMQRLQLTAYEYVMRSDHHLTNLWKAQVLQTPPSYFCSTESWRFEAGDLEKLKREDTVKAAADLRSWAENCLKSISQPYEKQADLMKKCVGVFRAGLDRYGSKDVFQSFPSATVSYDYPVDGDQEPGV